MDGIAAFFDVDHTVLEVNSGSKWVGYQWRRGQLTPFQGLLAIKWLVQYRFGLLDFESMTERILASYQGRAVQPIYDEVQRFFEQEVAWSICREARERIAEHRTQGHVVALLTSATRFVLLPLARELDLQHILCTELEVVDGHLSGRTLGPVCYGHGKVIRAEAFAKEHGVDLSRSFFYTDSVSDLPMLERVGQPRVINPDPRLRRQAARRGWVAQTWTAPPRGAAEVKDVDVEPGTR